MVSSDSNGRIDAYLNVSIGAMRIDTRKRHLRDVVNADFYEVFEIETQLPGDSLLRVEVKDYDGVDFRTPGLPKIPKLRPEGAPGRTWELPFPTAVDDVVGATEIDLEDRVFSETWQKHCASRPPVEWRALYKPPSTMPQVCACKEDVDGVGAEAGSSIVHGRGDQPPVSRYLSLF